MSTGILAILIMTSFGCFLMGYALALSEANQQLKIQTKGKKKNDRRRK